MTSRCGETRSREVLSVQAELTTVRGAIERLSAEQAHLEEQAAFSTITAWLPIPLAFGLVSSISFVVVRHVRLTPAPVVAGN